MHQKTLLSVAHAAAPWHIRTLRTLRSLCPLHVGLLALLCCALLAPLAPLPVAAQGAASPPMNAPAGQWRGRETTGSGRFQIWFADRAPVATQVDAYKQVADGSGEMMEDIFGQVLARGISIYLFTDDDRFVAVAPSAKDDPAMFAFMDRNGIYVSTPRSMGLKAVDFGRNLRGLLARETTAQLSGGNAPAGMLDGVERYAQAPPSDLQALVASLNQQVTDNRLAPWNTLWNLTDAQADAQTYSAVAFLFDIYGFRTFRTYLDRMRDTRDWRTAIPRAYTVAPVPGMATNTPAQGESLMSLETKWKAYLPQFTGGLWQRNQFTLYSTDDANRLLAQGQYSQAVTLLTPAIPFLQQIANPRRAVDAQGLLSRARAGAAAEITLRDAGQALEGNDYDRTITLVSQARTEYESIGRDARPSPLLAQYEDRAKRGKNAAADLAVAETAVGSWNVVLARSRADRALAAFTEFGNTPFADRAQAVIDRANDTIRTAALTTMGAGLGVLLLGLAISTGRRLRRQPAASLPPLE